MQPPTPSRLSSRCRRERTRRRWLLRVLPLVQGHT